jgi:uncharacterized membrane protein
MSRSILIGSLAVSLTLSAAIFGFFYAWVCSTMWGLDGADPRVAIAAMQAMNASVRNAVFAPAFFGTPVALLLTAGLAYWTNARTPALILTAAALVYFLGGMLLTMLVNVPMNEALAQLPVPQDTESARQIWDAYSPRWQAWNVTRTFFSGIALLLAVWATWMLAGASR